MLRLRLCCPHSGEQLQRLQAIPPAAVRPSAEPELHPKPCPPPPASAGWEALLLCPYSLEEGGSTSHPTPLGSAAACGQPAMPAQCCTAEHEGTAL